MTHKIVVGFDGSEGAKSALNFACGQAKLQGSEIVVAHVLDWSPYSFLTPDEIEERHSRRKEELKRAEEFIDLANSKNQNVKATDLHMVMLFAAARYNAHVCKNVVKLDEQEVFVTEMMKSYQEMLRNHLADPSV